MPSRRFCDAMIAIRKEAEDVITGKQPKDNNLLKNAPHPISIIALSESDWNRYGVFVMFFISTTELITGSGLIPANKQLILCHGCVKRNFGPLFLGSTMVNFPSSGALRC